MLFSIVVSITIALLTGCSLFPGDERPPSYAGYWKSTDGASFLELKEDNTGTFTLCQPDLDNDGLRYNFEAKEWPATIPITWEERAPDERVYLIQDWELRQETGTGFRTLDVILEWRSGALEMGGDLVVRYVKTEEAKPFC